jgi:hypothetical protein
MRPALLAWSLHTLAALSWTTTETELVISGFRGERVDMGSNHSDGTG